METYTIPHPGQVTAMPPGWFRMLVAEGSVLPTRDGKGFGLVVLTPDGPVEALPGDSITQREGQLFVTKAGA